MAITPRFNPAQPIPNNPFFTPQSDSISSGAGPLIVGAGISIDYTSGVISVAGGGGAVVSVGGTAPIVITGTASVPLVGIAPATTVSPGAVQLNNSTSSVSTSEALTAAMGKFLQDQISTLSLVGNLVFAGTYAGTMISVTPDGAAAVPPFVFGFNLPPASINNQDYFVIVSSAGTYSPPGLGPTAAIKGDWFLSTGSTWQYFAVGPSVPPASTTVSGIVELADVAEATGKTDTTRAVTPASLINYLTCGGLTRGQFYTANSVSGAIRTWSGVDGDVLTVDTLQPTGLSWKTPVTSAIPCSCIQAKGSIIVGEAPGLPKALPVGATGQVLTVVATNPTTCLAWCTPVAGGVYSGKGQVLVGTGGPFYVACTATGCGEILVSDSTCSAGVKWCTAYPAIGSLAIGCSSPGGVYSLPIGGNGQILTACNTCVGGAYWGAAGGSGTVTSVTAGTGIATTPPAGIVTTGSIALTNTGVVSGCYTYANICVDSQGRISAASCGSDPIPCSILTAKGTLVAGCAAGIPYALPIGTAGQVLTVDAACLQGMKWASAGGVGTVTSITAGTGLTGGTITSSGTIALPTVGPGAAVYSNPTSITLDLQGRVTAIATAAGGFIPCSIVQAKGSLITATAAGVPANFNVGSNGQVLTADSTTPGGLRWANSTSVGIATPTVFGTVLAKVGDGSTFIGCFAGNAVTINGNVGVGSCVYCQGTATGNTMIGANAGCLLTTGTNNVLIGSGAQAPSATSSCTLAIGYTTGQFWLTGDSTKAIKPGAGIIDCAGVCGTNGQVLMSNGANAICWGSVGGTGTVTQVSTGTGLTGGPVTTTGTIALANTTVSAGPYCYACICVDAQGRLTSATAGPTPLCAVTLTAKGSLITKCDANVVCALSVGTDGQVLTACAACTTGLTWAAGGGGGGIPLTCLTAKGALITASAASTVSTLGVGTDGQILTVDSACAGGIKWQTGASTAAGTPTVLGSVYGCSNTGTPFNVAFGYCALNTTVTGCYNTVVGFCSLRAITSGGLNTAIGFMALSANNVGCCNIAVGASALFNNTTGCNNIAFGYRALDFNTTCGMNVAIGCSALQNSNANNNVAVGHAALAGTTSGAQNTAIGISAGSNVATGTNNVLIGYFAQPSTTSVSNEVTITTATGSQRFTGTGNWAQISDVRDKTDIEDLALGLDFVKELKPRKFKWDMRHRDANKGEESSGFIAQEVLAVTEMFDAADYSGLVDTNDSEQYRLIVTSLIPPMVNALKELTAKVEALEAKLNG